MEAGGVETNQKEDRLSGLPSHIIEAILDCLPIREAVRTSILSSEWRNSWTRLTKLVFDRTFWRSRTGRHSKTIYHILLTHEGPIREFYLDVACFDSNLDVSFWLLGLSKKGVEKIEISGVKHFNRAMFSIPHSIFQCHELKKLRISNCVLDQPPEFSSFPNLVSLDLNFVSVDPGFLENLIRECPLLETLILVGRYWSSDCWERPIVLSSLSLKTLRFKNLSLGTVSFENIPKVTHLSLSGIYDERTDRQEPGRSWEQIVFPSGIKELSYQFSLLPPLHGNRSSCLPTELENLKRMFLVDLNIFRRDDVSFALCLIRSSPQLRCLSIHLDRKAPRWPETEMSQKLLESQTRESSRLSNVSTVWIHEMAGWSLSHYSLLVKIILLRCPNLQNLFIRPFSSKAHKVWKNISSDLIKSHLFSDKVQFVRK